MPRALRTFGTFLALLAVAAGAATGQVVGLKGLDGRVGASFDGTFTAADLTTSYQRYGAWLEVGTSGFLVDPRFSRFSLVLRPLGYRANASGFGNVVGGGTERGLGYDLSLSVLPAAIAGLNLRASSQDVRQRDPFGREVDGTFSDWQASLGLRFPPLPITFSARGTSRDFIQRPRPGIVTPISNTQNQFQFLAQNRKLTLRLTRSGLEDRVRNTDRINLSGQFAHRFRWGKGSRILSNYNYFDSELRRADSSVDVSNSAWSSRAWSQTIHLQHTTQVSSDWSYLLSNQERGGVDSRAGTGRLSLNYNPAGPTRGQLFTDYRDERANGSSSRRMEAGSSFQGLAPMPEWAKLNYGLSLSYTHLDQVSSGNGYVPVVGERHPVPPGRSFLLNNPNPDPASVVITGEDGIPDYDLGFDYELIPSGDLLEVVILLSGRIQVGELLEVSYRYERIGEGSTDFLRFGYHAAFSTGPITAYHRGTLARPFGDGDPFLTVGLSDRTEFRTGLRARTATPIGALEGFFERINLDANEEQSYAQTIVGLNLGAPISPRLSATLTAQGVFRRDQNAPRNELFGLATGRWQTTRRLALEAGISFRRKIELSETYAGQSLQYAGGHLAAEWLIHRTVVRARYDLNSWDYFEGGRRSLENRISLRVMRTF